MEEEKKYRKNKQRETRKEGDKNKQKESKNNNNENTTTRDNNKKKGHTHKRRRWGWIEQLGRQAPTGLKPALRSIEGHSGFIMEERESSSNIKEQLSSITTLNPIT